MKKILFYGLPPAALLAAVAVLSKPFVDYRLARSVDPEQGEVKLAGLRQPASIRRDRLGIPLIEARSMDDLALAVGYAMASDRLWQMTLMKMAARGRMAEILGEAALPTDVLMRTVGIERFAAAVLALSLFEGAYASEIYRAGIVSINKGQWEAAYSLGLGTFHTYKKVILPQAIRRILPPLTSQAVSLIKDSSLVSVLAVYEMTMQANAIVAETFLVFEVYFAIAAIYLLLTVSLSQVVNVMEKRLKVYD